MTATTTESPTLLLLLCPTCGYDLRGIEGSAKCPECGTAIDRGALGMSGIPWVRRKQVGTWRAYGQTVRLVMLRPGKMAAEIARPVSVEEARRFNRRTIVLAWLTVVPLILWLWAATLGLPVVYAPSDPAVTHWWWRSGCGLLQQYRDGPAPLMFYKYGPGNVFSLAFALECGIVLTLLSALLLWIGGMARVGSYFFHPRAVPVTQQNRAVAISYYACAPLAWTAALFPAFVYSMWWYVLAPMPWTPYGWSPRGVEAALAISLGGVALLLAWMAVVQLLLLRRTTQCGVGRMIAMALTLPLAWLAIGIVALSLPAGAFVLAVMVMSVW